MRSCLRSFAVIATVALVATMGAPLAQASALAASIDVTSGATATVSEGKSTTITGSIPSKYAHSMVLLELNDGQVNQEVAATVSDKNGNIRATVRLAGAGKYKGRWKVVRNGKSLWKSSIFPVQIAAGTRKPKDLEAATLGYTMSAPGQQVRGSVKVSRSAARGAGPYALRPRGNNPAPAVSANTSQSVESAAGDVARTAEATAAKAVEGIASNLALNAEGGLVGAGMSFLFGIIFPDTAAATADQVQQLSNQVQQVQSTLTNMQSQLTSLSTTVSQVQAQIVQTNASASAANCNVLLSEANGYVATIQNYYAGFQEISSPSWLNANLSGVTGQQGVKVVGQQIFGSGNTVPAFGSGVIALQTAVTSLANLLNSNGPSGTNGLVATCASAYSAQVASSQSTNTTSTIVPLGQVEQEYYSKIQPVVNYYVTWANLGQSVAAFGGYLASASLAGISTSAQAQQLCANAQSAGQVYPLSCAGVINNAQATQQATLAALKLAGASWAQVTGGLLAGDARVDSTSNYIQPAKNAWVQNIATFGQPLGSYYNLTGGSQPSGPASGTTALSNPTWLLGQNFTPAATAAWQWLLPFQNMPCSASPCTFSQTMSVLMGQAGLADSSPGDTSPAPANLILYTGENTSFSTSTIPAFVQPASVQYIATSSSFPGVTGTAASYIDTSAAMAAGSNPVLNAPSTASGNVLQSVPYAWGSPTTSGNLAAQCSGSMNGGCSTNGTATVSAAGPAGGALQNASAFYGPLSQANSYVFNQGMAPTYLTNYTNLTSTVTAAPGFMTFPGVNGSPVIEYMWPTLNLSTSPCAMTQFTSGIDGNAGVGNVCQNYFTIWMATHGYSTGPVIASTGPAQGTLTTAGNNAVDVTFTNSSNSAQTYTMYAGVTSGNAVVGSAVNTATGAANGATATSCTAVGNAMQCSLVLPPGQSVISIPVGSYTQTSQFQVVIAATAGGTTFASADTVTIAPYADSVAALPGAITNLAAAAGTNGTQSMSLAWTVPSASPALSGYNFTITDPNGNTTQQSTVGSGGPTVTGSSTAGGTAQVNLSLPNSTGGLWTFAVTAVSPAGSGPTATTTAAFGNSLPATPQNFTVTEGPGNIALSWSPVVASPILSNYALTITQPGQAGTASTTSTVNVTSPSYTIQNVSVTGKWTFSLTAVNALGASASTSAAINVTGIVPTRPSNVDVDVNETGWVTIAFNASTSVPSATNYYVALYPPGQTTPVASVQVPITGFSDHIRLRDFWQLASNSPTGAYTAVISPTNSLGVGQYGSGTLFVSSALVANSSLRNQIQVFLSNYPIDLIQQAVSACTGGFWNATYQVFGSCINGGFSAYSSTLGAWPNPTNATGSIVQNLQVSGLTSSGFTLTWQPPASNGGDPIIRYNIWNNGQYSSATGNSQVFTGLQSGQSYFVQVESQHQSGRQSLMASITVNVP